MEKMTHHPVDGILLVPVGQPGHAYLKTLVSGNTPIVTIDRPIEIVTTDSVGAENGLERD